MSKPFPFTVKYKTGATPITQEQAELLFTPEEIEAGEKRFDIKTYGPWSILSGCRGLATAHDFKQGSDFKIYGQRSLDKAKQDGYHIEGRVSIEGRKYRAFTSSQLFELPGGKLIDCAILHVCLNQPKS